ncbi:MAG: T9SS type A sorting domain-containing protein [Sphingobacteriaceae bacterium]|nr:T9SS type A sorting domain-containing protein [Sphingobacteriaceae bacterium]
MGIKEINDLENEIVVYPNPANDYLDIKSLNNFTDKLNVEVFDVIGKKVLSQTSTSSNLHMNCENLEQGLYVMRINVTVNKTTKVLVKKIIIQ